MRFEHVAERLTPFPTRLPPPADVLTAVLLDERVRRNVAPPAGVVARAAAVLVLIHPDDDGEARVVLTERATRDGHHSGEVSFPGGRAEETDRGPTETALREAEEEVALDAVASGVRVLGQLDRVWIPVSNFDITPIVAVADRMPALHPSEAEVARIVHARLEAFLPGAPVEVIERQIGDWPIRFGAYPIDGLAVWGATARILSQLGAIVAE